MLKRFFRITVLLATCGWTLAQQPLPIKQIFLYKNGMAYIVREGQIDSVLELSFHPNDMNDVLKTFTAWNPDDGSLYSLGYTAGIPADQILGKYPFNLRNPNASLAEFLGQVKGAPVDVRIGNRSVQGKLLSVHQQKKAVGDTLVDDARISILEDSGPVQTFWLSEISSIAMADEQLQQQLQSYLQILADGSQDVTKSVSIYPVPAAGPILVSYLEHFPVWKTSYRLQLGEKENSLQGWAMIDNPTGEEWDGVDLTLISGMPVSFVMNLYQPLYTQRSVVPVPSASVAAPRAYESAVREDAEALDEISRPLNNRAAGMAKLAPGGVVGGVPGSTPMSSSEAVLSPPSPPASRFRTAAFGATSEFVEAEAAQVQDYFEYRFPYQVRLAGRQSAFLPFLKKSISAKRLSIFNAASDRNHPLNGARITNDSGVPLEAGPITLFEEGRYAGEAVLDYTPRDDKRLISYGIDYEIQVAIDRDLRPERIAAVKIRKGVATATWERTQETRYELRNKADRDKNLIIEHPRQNGRKLKGIEADETTQNFYRFRVPLDAGEEKKFPVSEVLSRRTSLRIGDVDSRRIELFFSGWDIPVSLKKKLDEIITARSAFSDAQLEVGRINGEIKAISEDQNRIRENLKALRQSRDEGPLRQRYVQELTQQEDRLGALRTELRAAQSLVGERGEALAKLVAALDWGA